MVANPSTARIPEMVSSTAYNLVNGRHAKKLDRRQNGAVKELSKSLWVLQDL